MIFKQDEKVFSLAKAAAAVPYGDITALMEEFYCFLLIAGLFQEGTDDSGVSGTILPIASPDFTLPSGFYNPTLATMITKGLKLRYDLITRHPNLTQQESRVFTALNSIFTNDSDWFSHLTGKELVGIAYGRQFREPMKTIAHYVAVGFGQSDYPPAVSVERLYLSVFGNIHLAQHDPALVSGPDDSRVTLDAPVMRYGVNTKAIGCITALWAILSAQIDTLSQDNGYQLPGDYLGEMLSGYTFLTSGEVISYIPLPYYASSLYAQRLLGIDGFNPIQLSATFYRDFLYNNLEELKVSRSALLTIIINLMMEKMGETNLNHLFNDRSFYRKLTRSTLSSKTINRPALFRFALEALADDEGKEETLPDDKPSLTSTPSVDDVSQDPQTTDGGYDPSTPPPVSPVSTLPDDMDGDKDTIDLISFNKTGEGVNEDLYRQAVVALNDRLKNDDSLPVTAEVKDSLNYWVNGYLYRTAIQATKDHIQFLHLQTYLKTLSTKG